jgi:hypothetical protein
VQNADSLSPWIDTKKPSRLPASDSDYTYADYDDYPEESNSTDLSNALSSVHASSPGTSSSSVLVTPQSIGHSVQTARPTNPSKNLATKNVTTVGKRKPAIPPSPSSSGFTFFGVPLPSLNFDLWGEFSRLSQREIFRKGDI